MSFFQLFPDAQDARPEDSTLGKMGCRVCPLAKVKNANQGMNPSGAQSPVFYVIGGAPDVEDDARGIPFIGRDGQMIRKLLGKALSTRRMRIDDVVRFNNVVRTRTPGGRMPTSTEIACCRQSVIDDILASHEPAAVIAVGEVATEWALQSTAGVAAWRGRRAVGDFGGHKCWVYPVLHPEFVARNGGETGAAGAMLARDIELAVESTCASATLPVERSPAEIMSGFELMPVDSTAQDVSKALSRFEGKVVAFDLETHNHDRLRDTFRPYSDDAKVLSIAIADGESTVALLVDHPSAKHDVKSAVAAALGKCKRAVAHNLPFDLEWLAWHVMPDFAAHESMWACTQAQAYVIDNRPGLMNLDDLIFIHFGRRMKDAVPVDAGNLIHADIQTLLTYNAYDAWWTRRLWDRQEKIIADLNLQTVADSQHGRVLPLVAASVKGIILDAKVAAKLKADVEADVESTRAAIRAHDDVKRWEEATYKGFDVTVKEHLVDVLQNYAGIELPKTAKGNPSLSAKVVGDIDHPIVKKIGALKEYDTLLGTFIRPMQSDGKHVWPDGKLHPKFNPTRTITRRLSSSSPNGQNFPKRKSEHVRNLIRAPDGHKIVSVDYGQMEARFIAADSQDKEFCDAIITGYDIHASWAARIASAYPQWEVTDPKERRNMAKGGMVFASFYKATAPTIASACKIPVGIAESLLREFWRTFAGVEEWHKYLIETYRRRGYIELASGFRCHGLFNQWQAVNYRVQGSASDVVVRAMRMLTSEANRLRRPQLQAVLNIHDDLTFYLPDESLQDDIEIIAKVMLQRPPFFRQIPLAIEVSTGDAWGSMSEYAVINEGDLT